MSAASKGIDEEIDKNFARFLELLPSLVPDRHGSCALMRQGEIVEFFPTAIEAQVAGNRRFADGVFSIQEVQEFAEELGCFAYALSTRTA